MFLLNAAKSCLTLKAGEMLVAGSVNVHDVKFEFSDDWSDLVKTVTFRTVSDSRSVILNEEGECIIPWEVLKDSSPYLYVGLIGTRDAEVVLPTIWADLGEVRNGTEPGADVTDPTPTVYEQVLSELGSRANNLNVKDKKLQLRSGETVLSEVELPKQEAAEPGTTDHTALLNRDAADQHPMSAITGLEEALKKAGADSWEDIGTKQAFEPIHILPQRMNENHPTKYESIDLSESMGGIYYKVAEVDSSKTYEDSMVSTIGEYADSLGKLSGVSGEEYASILQYGELLYISYQGEIFDDTLDPPEFTASFLIVKKTNPFGVPLGVWVRVETWYEVGPVIISKETITPLPTEYLPTTVPVVQTAQVGQTIVVKAVDESGKPTEWEAADMGGGKQPDWNQNDESQPDYVKNRTHWMERPFEPIVWDGSTDGRDSVDVSLAFGYPVGSVIAYKVSDQILSLDELSAAKVYGTYEGKTVQGEIVNPMETVEGVMWMATYHTKNWIDDNTFEDFCTGNIMVSTVSGDFSSSLGFVVPSAGMYMLQSTVGFAPHTVELNWDVYHKLSADFLPDTVATVEYVNELITGAIGGSY